MTGFDDFWEKCCKRNPELRDGSIKVTFDGAAKLCRFAEQAFRAGFEAGKRDGVGRKKAADDFGKGKGKPDFKGAFDGIFGDLFGGKK